MRRFVVILERIRALPEPVRRQVFWIVVVVLVVCIGALWAATLRWQIGAPEEPTGDVAGEERVSLPTFGESFAQGKSVAGAALRNFLRKVLLGEEAAR